MAWGQTDAYHMPGEATMTDCYPGRPHTSGRQFPTGASSTNGAILTPRGNLKILVIFAGYDEESGLGCSSYNAPDWPNVDPSSTQPNGRTFPAHLGDFFYTNQKQFSPTATDQSFSNFFYQMSRTSTNPFRVTFGYLPARINVSAATYGSNLAGATAAVLAQAVTQYPNFDWASYDQRTNQPYFASDNSTSGPDGKLDYVVVCWRTYNSCGVAQKGSSGYAGPGPSVFGTAVAIPPAGTRTQTYYIYDGHVQTGGGIDVGVFLHEFAHNLHNGPHQLGAAAVHGNHFYVTQGWGMMSGLSTMFSANAWERWYNGWTELRTGPTGISSDIQDATSLTATAGVFTLRDFVTTGDVMRISIPNSGGQYLWLENRARNDPFDRRNDRVYQTAGDGLAFAAAPVGLLAMVESLASRTAPLSYTDIFTPSKVNQLRVLSAGGSFDYVASGPPTSYNNHLWGNLLYNFLPTASSASCQSQISGIRLDNNGDGVINYDAASGNGDIAIGNEGALQVVANGQINDGFLGPNIGTRTVGFRYGLDSKTLLTANPYYDATAQTLLELPLGGLSVQITGYDAATGDLTVKVRYDDTQLRPATRWTGQLRTYPVANATNGAAIWINSGGLLTLDRGTTPQRSSRGPGNDFVNDTRLTVSTGTRLRLESAAHLDLRGQGTTLYVEPSGSVTIGGGGGVTAYAGTTISLEKRADLGGSGELKAGAYMIVRSNNTLYIGPYSW